MSDEFDKSIIAEIHEEGGIYIDEEARGKIAYAIQELMHHFHPQRQGSDFRCEFCSQEPQWDRVRSMELPIKHRDNCEGNEILALLGFPNS